MILSGISKRGKYIFSITVIVIVAALLYNFIIEAGFKKWQILNNEIAVKRAKINMSIRLMKKRDSIIREYNEYTKSAKNISGILNDMEHQADMLGIKTSNIKPGQEIEKGLYKECAIELQIEGEMANIIKFVSQISKPPTLAILKKFDFSLISQNPSVFKGTITLSKLII